MSDNEVMLYVYKINTKNRLTRYFYGVYYGTKGVGDWRVKDIKILRY